MDAYLILAKYSKRRFELKTSVYLRSYVFTGVIKGLHYTRFLLLQLTITVRDSGQPQSLLTHGTLTVEIIDIDDNPPVFDQVYIYG